MVYFPSHFKSQHIVIDNVSTTEPFKRLLNERVRLCPKKPIYHSLELTISQIRDFTYLLLSVGLKLGNKATWPSLIGSRVAHLFADGPKPNDTDIEVSLPSHMRNTHLEKIQRTIFHWMRVLILQATPTNSTGVIVAVSPNAYSFHMKQIPHGKGWIVNLNAKTQVVFKYDDQQSRGLSALDGLQVTLDTGLLSMKIGNRFVTSRLEFNELKNKIKRRDLENGILKGSEITGRLWRVLHYLGHGAKISSQDIEHELNAFHDIPLAQLCYQYVRHLQSHFPTPTGKLVDYLNFLTLIKNQPDRCKDVSLIIWREKELLQFGPSSVLALCIASAPQLTPYLLKFIHGALFHDLVSKDSTSKIRAWYLPFLKNEIRSFFVIDCRNMDRYLTMDHPGKIQTPDTIVLEFFRAWEYLENALPNHGYQFENLRPIFNALGIGSTVLSPGNRRSVEKEFANIHRKPHIQRFYDHFSSDQLIQEKGTGRTLIQLFKSALCSSRFPIESQRFAQDNLIKASVFTVCPSREDVLLHSYHNYIAKKYTAQMGSYMTAHGLFPFLFNACVNQPSLHRHIVTALLYVETIPPKLTKKICSLLMKTHEALGPESTDFKQGWFKAAKKLNNPELNQKYLAYLGSNESRKTDPLSTLVQIEKQLNQSRARHASRWLQILQGQKKDILSLPNMEKELFHDLAWKILSIHHAAHASLTDRMITLIDKCQIFNRQEIDQVYQIKACNAALLSPSEHASALNMWIIYRKNTFGSAFALPIEPLMKALRHLSSFPNEVRLLFKNLMQDLGSQTTDQQMRVLHEALPYFHSPNKEQEFLVASRLLQFIKDPRPFQKHMDQVLQWTTKVQKKKKTALKEHKTQEYTSKALGTIKLDADTLFKLFKEMLDKKQFSQAHECLIIGELHLKTGSLFFFKERVISYLKRKNSSIGPFSTSDQIYQYIQHTLDLLPMLAKLLPEKTLLSMKNLIKTCGNISKSFPSEITALIFRAKASRLPCKPAEWYDFHTSAARFYVDNPHWKSEHAEDVLKHLQAADLAVSPAEANLSQRNDMIQIHREFAIHFLKRAIRGFGNTPDWIKFENYIRNKFIIYLTEDKYRKDGLGAKCILDLFIALNGISVIFTCLRIIADNTTKDRRALVKFLVANKGELEKSLRNHHFDEFLDRLKVSERVWLLAHVLDMLSSFSEIDYLAFEKMKDFTFHRPLCEKANREIMIIQQQVEILASGKITFSGQQLKNHLLQNETLLDWDYDCCSLTTNNKEKGVLSVINHKLI